MTEIALIWSLWSHVDINHGSHKSSLFGTQLLLMLSIKCN